jgi:nitroreductase
MEIYEALYTTRAMRRMKSDPIPADVVGRILDAGLRAPTGGNAQDWRFMVVTDRDKIAALAPLYKAGLMELFGGHYAEANAQVRAATAAGNADARTKQVARVLDSSEHLAEHFHEAPMLVFGFTQTNSNPGSIWPALWSMCLAARAEGVGSTVTTVLNMFAPRESNDILGIPADEKWIQHGCLPMGYPTGSWGIPSRKPINKVVFLDTWGSPAPFPAPDKPF